MSVHEIESQALRLPRHERARLAQHLIASLEEDDELDEAWLEEAERRSEELRSGKQTAIPAARVFADVRAAAK